MKKTDLLELQYITHINNVKSIMDNGILSHNMAQEKGIKHDSVAMEEVQAKRKSKSIPGGKLLHDYANLYVCARNPMLFKLNYLHKQLCVLRIKPNVLEIEGAVVSTGNAASDYISFYPADRGLEMLDESLVFATYWTDSDYYAQLKKTTAKCAEVLVPKTICSSLIFGAYVSCDEAKQFLNTSVPTLNIELKPQLFFKK